MIQPVNVKNPCNVPPRAERPATIIYNTDYNAIKISINGASVNAPAQNPNAGQGAYGNYDGRNDGYQQQNAPSYYNYPQANLYDYPQAEKQAYYMPAEKPVDYALPAGDIAKNYATNPVSQTVMPPQEVVSQPAAVEVPQPQVVIKNPVSTPIIQPQVMQQNINYAVANAPAPVITGDAKNDEKEVLPEAEDNAVIADVKNEELPATAVAAAAAVPEETAEKAITEEKEDINDKNVRADENKTAEVKTETVKAEEVAVEKTTAQAIAADKAENEAVKAEAVAAAAVSADETSVQTVKSEEVKAEETTDAIPAQASVQDAPKVEIREPEELRPQIDINAFIAKLTNPDFDKQALAMEAIALSVREDPEKATELLDEGVINALEGILTKDTKDLIGPSKEQTEARVKIMQGKKVSDIEKELANTITPLEQAERNKSYALFSMAILEKLFNNEVEKLSGQIVPFKDIPGIMTVVEQMSSNPNPTVRASAVEALNYIQRPEYNEDLNALFKIALNDPDRSVRETAKAASDRLNRA